jgi:hypothetical protein
MAMKSERSQVQESDLLADKIEKLFVQVKPYLPVVLGLLIASVIGMLGYGIYSSQSQTRAAEAWTDFYFSDTAPQNLEAISKDFSDTSAGLWARLTAGDANMSRAMEKWNIDRTLSDQFFDQAANDYKAALALSTEPFSKSRALMGLAQAYEGHADRTEAIATYKELSGIPGLPTELQAEINSRLQWLESRSGETFYTWYLDRRNAPQIPSGGNRFPDLPALPDIDFKNPGSLPPSVPTEPSGGESGSEPKP